MGRKSKLKKENREIKEVEIKTAEIMVNKPDRVLCALIGLILTVTGILLIFNDNYSDYCVFVTAPILLYILLRNYNIKHEFRLSILMTLCTAYVSLYWISLIWAKYRSLAYEEANKYFAALCIFISVFILVREKTQNFKFILRFFCIAISIICFVSIELATTGIGDLILKSPTSRFFEANTRIRGILGNPNILAPIAAIGFLLGLWIYLDSIDRKWKNIGFSCAMFSCVGFLLCFSLGALITFPLAIVGLILIMPKGEKIEAFGIIVFSLIVSAVVSSVVFLALGAQFMFAIFAVTLYITVCIYSKYIYEKLTQLLKRKIKYNKKSILMVTVILLSVSGLFLICALNFSGAYNLKDKDDYFKRAIKPVAGKNTIEVSASPNSSLNINIRTQDIVQTTMREGTVVLDETGEGDMKYDFTVPDGSVIAYIMITAKTGSCMVRDVKVTSLNNSSIKEINLKYKLLPEFIVNRLQGIWANENAIQRFVFYKDGLKLAMMSPILGSGGGSYPFGHHMFADYYYETVHSHNQYIESFFEIGILGLLLFLAMAVYSIYLVIKSKSRDAAFLLSLLIMIFVHSLIEVDFYSVTFKILAFSILAVVAAIYDKSHSIRGLNPKITRAASIGVISGAFILCFMSFAAGASVEQASNTNSLSATTKALENAIKIAPLNNEDFLSSYIMDVIQSDNASDEQKAKALMYANDLQNKDSYSISANFMLMRYYFYKDDYDNAYKYSDKAVKLARSYDEVWNKTLNYQGNILRDIVFNNVQGDSEKLIDSILGLYGTLTETDSALIKKVTLTYDGVSAINLAQSLKLGLNKADSKNTVFDSAVMIDADDNAIHDMLDFETGKNDEIKQDGSTIKLNIASGSIKLMLPEIPADKGSYVMRIYTAEDTNPVLFMNGARENPTYNGALNAFEINIKPQYANRAIEFNKSCVINRIVLVKP